MYIYTYGHVVWSRAPRKNMVPWFVGVTKTETDAPKVSALVHFLLKVIIERFFFSECVFLNVPL